MIIVSVTSVLYTGVGMSLVPKYDLARERLARTEARWVRAHPEEASKLEALTLPGPRHVRYGWGFVSVPPLLSEMREALLADAPLPRPERRERPVTRHEGYLLGGALGGMLALASKQVLARYQRLRDAVGVDEPVPEPRRAQKPRDPYRSATWSRTRRRLSPEDTLAFASRCAIGFGTWALSTALFAFAVNGTAPLPMPTIIGLWALLHLPATILFMRFRAHLWWAPALSLFGATLATIAGSWLAALVPLALTGLLSLTAFFYERDKASRGELV
ncbi:MAG: hypothetical protein MUF34_24640 [Polyangiaceae bacterium]|nr:hypothetical protein [Polyangiaceae bacterium]